MASNICSICLRKFEDHSLDEVKVCEGKYDELQFDRLANELCNSCGCPSDIMDSDNKYWCHGCLIFYTEGR